MPSRSQPAARKGKANRVMLNQCRIDPATMAQFSRWQRRKVSQGVLIDRLAAHALRTNFNPVTDCI